MTTDQPSEPDHSSLIDQVRRVFQDGIDYAASVVRLLQAQIMVMTLSSVTFLLLVFFSVLTGVAAFVLLTVAFGIWLTHQTGSAGWALLIIGGVYGLLAAILGGYAFRWLARLRS